MNCYKCGKPTKVVDTYKYEDRVYRRRKCKCGNIIYTCETETTKEDFTENYYKVKKCKNEEVL